MEPNMSMRIRVSLQVGNVDDGDKETIVGEIDAVESFWAGGDLSNAAAVALFDKLRDQVLASNPC